MGAGPRYCIGARLGFIMLRMALSTMIYNYNFEAVDEKIGFLKSGFILTDQHNIQLRISQRKA